MAAKPTADRTTESTSSGTLRGVVTLRTSTAPTVSAVSATGRTSQNIQRQDSTSRTIPPTVGPTAGATAMTMEITPIVRPRREAGTTLRTVVNSNGIISAVPTAWTTRPPTRRGKLTARAAASVPRLKNDIAATNTVRRLSLVSR